MDRETFGRTLADTAALLNLATRAAGIGIWDWDIRTNAITYSERAKEICGFPLDQPVTYEQVRGVTHPDDLPRTSAMARRALDPEKREQQPYEYRLLLADGSIRWVLAYGQAIFEYENGAAIPARYVGTLQDITARHHTEAQLRDSESRLRLAVDAAKMAVWEYNVVSDKTTFSPELVKLLGFPQGSAPTVEDLRSRYLPGEQDRVRAAGREALARGETYFECEYQIARFDGEQRWMLLRAEIQLSPENNPVRVLGVVFDITGQKRSTERQALLVDELNHRVKNTLAIVQSITKLTLRNARDPTQASMDIESRIMSLSRAHDLLTEQKWEHVSLRQLVTRVLSLCDDKRISLSGPDVWLRPRLAVDLSMILHELLTNAIKYGALSAEKGRLNLCWSAITEGMLTMRWSELDGTTVSAPKRKGLGSRLIENLLKQHGGAAEMNYEPGGLSSEIRFRLEPLKAGREGGEVKVLPS